MLDRCGGARPTDAEDVTAVMLDVQDDETLRLLRRYIGRLRLPTDGLRVTTDRAAFARWLGRPVGSALGGAYVRLADGTHAILVNLSRIDRSRPRALEVVVAEELLHMRDRIDGDLRRHAKHGHDRIAHRVASLTGASLDEIRGCLLPVKRRPYRYLYGCPGCGLRVPRRVRGDWSCRRCSPVYDRRFRLRLITDVETAGRGDGASDRSRAAH